jgi:hypothetical protein
MLSEATDLAEVCNTAFAFRNNTMDAKLKCIMDQQPRTKSWRKIRHYLGRIGAWPRAIDIVVRIWPAIPVLSRESTVEAISGLRPLVWAPENELELANVLRAAIPSLHTREYHPRIRARLTDASQNQREVLGKASSLPVAHAEAALADHLLAIENFRFLGGIRYIGVSKPSCYCCHVYLKHHPIDVTLHQAHNKIYAKWSPAVLDSYEDGGVAVTTAFGRLAECILEDIENAVRGRDDGEDRSSHQDSVTDMSSSRGPNSVRDVGMVFT